jgi:hypothetical protein
VALGKATITDDMWLNEDGIEHYFRVREIVAIKIVSFARNSTSDVSKTWEVVAYLSISDNGVPRRVTLYKGTSYGCERYVNWFVRASGGLCRR